MQGLIQRINKWSSGKGFFFKIAERDESYFAYGIPSFKVGDSVSFEPQGKKFNNATLVKFGKAKGVKEKPVFDAAGSKPPVGATSAPANSQEDIEEYFEKTGIYPLKKNAQIFNSEKPIKESVSRDDIITRLACLKAACTFLAGKNCHPNEIIGVSKTFERYARGEA